MDFTVYLELFGKKMKVVIDAKDKVDARIKVRDSIKFHKVELMTDEMFESLKGIFGGKT